jgi:hypothetical protein
MSRQSSQARIRCAVYTRLSRETNQEFSSCEAQFDACRAFIQPFVVYFPTFRFDRLFLAFAAARMRDVAKCG